MIMLINPPTKIDSIMYITIATTASTVKAEPTIFKILAVLIYFLALTSHVVSYASTVNTIANIPRELTADITVLIIDQTSILTLSFGSGLLSGSLLGASQAAGAPQLVQNLSSPISVPQFLQKAIYCTFLIQD